MSGITLHFKCVIMFFCVINDPKVQHSPVSIAPLLLRRRSAGTESRDLVVE